MLKRMLLVAGLIAATTGACATEESENRSAGVASRELGVFDYRFDTDEDGSHVLMLDEDGAIVGQIDVTATEEGDELFRISDDVGEVELRRMAGGGLTIHEDGRLIGMDAEPTSERGARLIRLLDRAQRDLDFAQTRFREIDPNDDVGTAYAKERCTKVTIPLACTWFGCITFEMEYCVQESCT